jgi:hypothetical protein
MLNDMRKEFLEPSDEFTPVPFWFWNDTLEEAELLRQIRDFRAKGVMGFVIHPRIGIPKETEYLSDRFMALVKLAVAEASAFGMRVVLYDEAMYPSGSAHGMVVKGNPEYASRGLRMVESPCGSICEDVPEIPEIKEGETLISVLAVEKVSPEAINPNNIIKLDFTGGKAGFTCGKAGFQVPLSGQWSILYFIEGFAGGTIRGIHFGEDDGEPDAPPSGDLLNPAAMDKFIRLTYDRYYEVLGDYFGTTVTAMFTDEPDVLGRCSKPGYRPWTTGFLEWYADHGGSERDLPLLWFDAGQASADIRKKYKKAVNKRLEYAYYGKISDWCLKHRIALTGHPHESDEIGFLKHFQIPGQDIVWRWVAPEDGKGIEGIHSTMGKCGSDAARHAARRRNSNECFGCCGPRGIHWAFSCDDMKWYLDWLFVRGVNLLYPHAFYYSVRGEKRSGERPPDVGPNNIWWKYYHSISSYIKRMCWLMTDSINSTPVAVLCEEDSLPWHIAKPLFQNQIEFNYLEDTLILSGACEIADGFLSIQKQQYRILLVEDPDVLTPQLCEKLQRFTAGGGSIIACSEGEHGSILDNIIEAESVDAIAGTAKKIGITEIAEGVGIAEIAEKVGIAGIAEEIEIDEMVERISGRDVFVAPPQPNLRISHVVKNSLHFYLLVNEGESAIDGNLSVNVNGSIEIWDPWDAACKKAEGVSLTNNGLCIPIHLERRDSTIFCIDPSGKPELHLGRARPPVASAKIEIKDNWSVTGMPQGIRTGIALESWTTWDGLEDFSGTLTYRSGFELESAEGLESLILELGEVHEIAHLYINGIDAGYRLWAPYAFDIKSCVKSGYNSLEVEVTNSMANRLSRSRLPSGLLGPVSLTLYQRPDIPS